MLHLDNGGNHELYRWRFDNIIEREVSFDLIGASYYPYWHGTLEDLRNNLNDIARCYDKDIVVVEAAYPFTADDKDNFANVIQDQRYPGYPFTPEGQQTMLAVIMDIVREIPNGHGLGIMWWDATWTAVKGNGWENQALFDFDNRALPAMKMFDQA